MRYLFSVHQQRMAIDTLGTPVDKISSKMYFRHLKNQYQFVYTIFIMLSLFSFNLALS